MTDHIPHETLATGYRPPTTKQPGPHLVILHSQAAFDRSMGSLRQTNKSLDKVTVDWKSNVLLWASCAVGAGMDSTPEVKSLTRNEGKINLVIRLREHPNPQGMDVVTQAWILISVAKSVFDKPEPTVRYEVEHAGEGTVVHDR